MTLLLIASGLLPAQEVLFSDQSIRQPAPSNLRESRPEASQAKTTTLTLPFFDDFSNNGLSPDTLKWLFPPLDQCRPTLSIQKGLNVPSKGVATFDGVSFQGVKYEIDLASGEADTLTSQPIDLSGLSVADSVYLSFFVERGGTGESPEALDSLVLLFDSTGDYEYMKVWALKGLGSSESNFQLYHVRLDSQFFFHSNFHFKFVSMASLNGELDQFHLDYVYMNAGRTSNDAAFADASITRIEQGPIFPYTAMPRKLYPGSNLMATMQAALANAGDPATSANLSFTLDDPTGANTFSGTTIVSASVPALAGFGQEHPTTAAFSDQSANLNNYGAMRVTAVRTGPADAHSSNDTLTTTYRLDSILALDDGVSDWSYGLLAARAFCQEFHIPRADTLVAVWMRFAPSIYYNPLNNQSIDMDGKGFRMVVWDTLGVDSSLSETSGGMNVSYGNGSNAFVRYQLINPVVVPTTFWVGMRQSDGHPIGIGFDKNSSDNSVYYENNTAEFQLSTNIGRLMIRPEFKTKSSIVAASPTGHEAVALQFQVAPQPVTSDEIRLVFKGDMSSGRQSFRLIDLQGRELQVWENLTAARTVILPVPQGLGSGIYLLQASHSTGQGHSESGWTKVQIVR
ncbi:MAG: hypothetical protein U0176_06635 [Bacteroidia bacterium]